MSLRWGRARDVPGDPHVNGGAAFALDLRGARQGWQGIR